MWRRAYLLLLLIRVYFALSPSYVHPDEHFQSLEVFAGRIYSYPSQLTWEFVSDNPIRSVFPLWPVYGLPMNLVKWFYNETGLGSSPPPELIYYILRGVMFVLSFVLEDWAVYELAPTPRHRLPTVVLVASSYVTWTYQTHTFSNSLETLLVTWGLVLIQRIVENKRRSAFFSPAVLSLVVVLGVFNRITFPAFLLIPGLQLLPHFVQKSFSLAILIACGSLFSAIAILTDTIFYRSVSLLEAIRNPAIITPLNNLLYNSNSLNLAEHGLHPHYQHFLVNLPQLLGPALVVLVLSAFTRSAARVFNNRRAIAALSGTMILSAIPHQEPRFLLPCVPLLLTCIRPLKSRPFLISWVVFNALLGFLMGVYHQGGVVPAQLAMPSIVLNAHHEDMDSVVAPNATVFWWKTYSPPLWLLGDNSGLGAEIHTLDLMGMRGHDMIERIESAVPSCSPSSSSSSSSSANNKVFLVAPRSATFLDTYTSNEHDKQVESIRLKEQWTYRNHLNLDDIDIGEDGVLGTVYRVLGRHGLTVWSVERTGCNL